VSAFFPFLVLLAANAMFFLAGLITGWTLRGRADG
jgi:hypothetical protein